MPLIAEAQIETDQAARFLVELCRQLDEKARTKPQLGVRVKWTETMGTADFGWGRCALSADASTLTLRAEAADDEALRQLCELVSRHLEQHAGDDDGELTLTWWRDGKPVVDTHHSKRDAMRRFHRRMRH